MWVGIAQPAEDPMEQMMEEGEFSLLSILLPATFRLVSSAFRLGLNPQLLCFGMTHRGTSPASMIKWLLSSK